MTTKSSISMNAARFDCHDMIRLISLPGGASMRLLCILDLAINRTPIGAFCHLPPGQVSRCGLLSTFQRLLIESTGAKSSERRIDSTWSSTNKTFCCLPLCLGVLSSLISGTVGDKKSCPAIRSIIEPVATVPIATRESPIEIISPGLRRSLSFVDLRRRSGLPIDGCQSYPPSPIGNCTAETYVPMVL